MHLDTATMEAPDAKQPRDMHIPRASLIAGLLICGGRSRRMGCDKAHVDLEGRTLLERAAGLLREYCGEVSLACGAEPRYEDLGLPLVLDVEPDIGPLAGLIAGLEACAAERLLVIATDMPRLSREVFDVLLERAREEDLDACFLASEHGREPLCAIYSRRCLPHMKRALSEGRRRVTGFLEPVDAGHPDSTEVLRVGEVDISELPGAGDGEEVLTNLNTLEDLARERAARHGENRS